MDHHASLGVDLRRLAVVVDPVEILQAGGMRGRDLREPFLEGQPDGHRVDADGLPRQARHEQLRAVLFLDQARGKRSGS